MTFQVASTGDLHGTVSNVVVTPDSFTFEGNVTFEVYGTSITASRAVAEKTPDGGLIVRLTNATADRPAAAAEKLGVDLSTVFRRLNALEGRLQVRLFDRHARVRIPIRTRVVCRRLAEGEAVEEFTTPSVDVSTDVVRIVSERVVLVGTALQVELHLADDVAPFAVLAEIEPDRKGGRLLPAG